MFLPGWATDERIFSFLKLWFNYLMPKDFSPYSFESQLLRKLKELNIKKVSLFGFSLGGFVAAEFAGRYPDLIDELILVSVRKSYSFRQLASVKTELKKNKKVYLYRFYRQCFACEEQFQWFKKNFAKEFCQKFSLSYLLKSLDYLQGARIKPHLLRNIKKIKIIHGEYDNIAPLREAQELKESLSQAEFFCIRGAGHIPFLRDDFSYRING